MCLLQLVSPVACVESAILTGWVTLRLNFKLKGHVSRQHLWTVRWGSGYTTTLPLEVFTPTNVVADFIGLKLNFIKKKTKTRLLSHPLGIRDNVCTPSVLAGRSDFLFITIELFRYLLPLRRYKRKSVDGGAFRKGWVTLSADFRRKEASPTNHCWCKKTRVIARSCGIKMSAVRCLFLSQSTRTGGRTYGQTDIITSPKTALA